MIERLSCLVISKSSASLAGEGLALKFLRKTVAILFTKNSMEASNCEVKRMLSLWFNNVAQVSNMAYGFFLITKSQPSEMISNLR